MEFSKKIGPIYLRKFKFHPFYLKVVIKIFFSCLIFIAASSLTSFGLSKPLKINYNFKSEQFLYFKACDNKEISLLKSHFLDLTHRISEQGTSIVKTNSLSSISEYLCETIQLNIDAKFDSRLYLNVQSSRLFQYELIETDSNNTIFQKSNNIENHSYANSDSHKTMVSFVELRKNNSTEISQLYFLRPRDVPYSKLEIMSGDEFLSQFENKTATNHFFAGVLFSIAIASLFMGLLFKKLEFIFVVPLILSAFIVQSIGFHKFILNEFLPSSANATSPIYFSTILLSFFIIVFSIFFLKSSLFLKKWNFIAIAILAVHFFIGIYLSLQASNLAFQLTCSTVALGLGHLFSGGLLTWNRKSSRGPFYLAALILFSLALILLLQYSIHLYHIEQIYIFSAASLSIISGVLVCILALFFESHSHSVKLKNSQLLKTLTHESGLAPSFIMHSLNTILFQLSKQPQDSELALARLSRLIRLTHENSAETVHALERELTLVDIYIQIEKLRFGNRLKFSLDFSDKDENSLNFKIPVFAILVLIENAIKHGISQSAENHFINITLSFDDNAKLKVVAKNSVSVVTQIPMSEFDLNKSQKTGHFNLEKRLQLIYEKNYFFCFSKSQDKNNSKLDLAIASFEIRYV